MKLQIILVLFMGILFQGLSCYGQVLTDSTKTLRIETIDGNIYIGNLITEDSLTLVVKTERLGVIHIPLADIKSRTELSAAKKVEGQFWLPNPQSSRYFWAPNGYGLEEGSAYYQNIWILYNQVSVGLTKNFSIGAGMLPLFLFAGASTPIFFVPKISLPVVRDKFSVGTGAFLGTILGEETGWFGLLYGTSTFGSRDRNISLGMAYGFSQDQWMQRPLWNISSMIRTGPKGYLITENYIISGSDATVVIVSLGGRTMIRSVGLDYSLWLPFSGEMDSFVAIPFLGITVPIGRKK
ncbi:MAG: hypothetical protein JW830_02760 [Bacteroidales bacterium]|nr:hypothetical protein [Bacteroidales bacterium]